MDEDLKLRIRRSRALLQNPNAYVDEHGGYSEWPGHKDGPPTEKPLIVADELLGRCKKGQGFRQGGIREIATRLHRIVWDRRVEFWPSRLDMGPLEILDPTAALAGLGFNVEMVESLGQYSGRSEAFEVAGTIDQSDSTARVSRRFWPEIRRFTVAHELGHTILHSESGLHRDRALDGTRSDQSRIPVEFEADTFAAYFLMPEKQVRLALRDMFLTDRFELFEYSALR